MSSSGLTLLKTMRILGMKGAFWWFRDLYLFVKVSDIRVSKTRLVEAATSPLRSTGSSICESTVGAALFVCRRLSIVHAAIVRGREGSSQ